MRWRGLEPPRPQWPPGPQPGASTNSATSASLTSLASVQAPHPGAVSRVRRVRDLCSSAVEAALAAGASYADARAVVRRSQAVGTKNGRVDDLSDVETEGIGVRVLVGGAWGFACDRRLEQDAARQTA